MSQFDKINKGEEPIKNPTEKPKGGAAMALAHFLNGYIGLIMSNLNDDQAESSENNKEQCKLLFEKFIKETENILKEISEGKLNIEDTVNLEEIREIYDFAKSINDPSDPIQIQKLLDLWEPIDKKRTK